MEYWKQPDGNIAIRARMPISPGECRETTIEKISEVIKDRSKDIELADGLILFSNSKINLKQLSPKKLKEIFKDPTEFTTPFVFEGSTWRIAGIQYSSLYINENDVIEGLKIALDEYFKKELPLVQEEDSLFTITLKYTFLFRWIWVINNGL